MKQNPAAEKAHKPRLNYVAVGASDSPHLQYLREDGAVVFECVQEIGSGESCWRAASMLLLSKQLFEAAGVRVDVADEGGEDLPLSIYSSAREEELVFDAEGNAHLRQGALLSLSVGKSSPRATGAQLLLPKLLRSAKSCQWYVLSVMKTEDESKVVIGTTEQHGTKQTSRIPASELCFTVHYSPATQRVMVSLRGFVQFESAWAAWARPYMRWKRLREAEAFCNTIAREASHTV